MKIDKNKYTHYGYFSLIPIYFNVNNNELVGRNEFFDFLVEYIGLPLQGLIIFLTSIISPETEPIFLIRITKEIKDGNTK